MDLLIFIKISFLKNYLHIHIREERDLKIKNNNSKFLVDVIPLETFSILFNFFKNPQISGMLLGARNKANFSKTGLFRCVITPAVHRTAWNNSSLTRRRTDSIPAGPK